MNKLIILIVFLFVTVVSYSQVSNKSKEYIEYHDNGQISQIGELTNNKLSGKWISYNSQGYVKTIGFYKNGFRTGTWTFNKRDKITKVTYKKNKIIHVKEIPNKNIVLNF